LDGHTPIGFQTPAKAYGSQLVFDLPDVTWLPWHNESIALRRLSK
jgi:hypothetical protein